MLTEDWVMALSISVSIAMVATLVCYVDNFWKSFSRLIQDIWFGIKGGLNFLIVRPSSRTPIQKKFNTDLRWHEVRWSIARMEHEMFPPEAWTHSMDDCVHPVCSRKALKEMWHQVSSQPKPEDDTTPF